MNYFYFLFGFLTYQIYLCAVIIIQSIIKYAAKIIQITETAKRMDKKNEIVVIQLTPSALQEALDKASALGAMRAMKLCGVPVRDMLSRVELSKKFGRGKVDRWIKAGVLTPHRDGESSRSKYKLSEVLTLFN